MVNSGWRSDRIEGYFAAYNNFAERQPELAQSLLLRLLDQIHELDKRVRASLIAMFLIAVTFELLNRNLLGEASAFGVKVSKLGFLRYLCPVAAAFILLQIITLARDIVLCQNVAEAICIKTYPELHRSRLFQLVVPSSGIFSSFNPSPELVGQQSSRYRAIIDGVEVAAALIAVPLVFNTYSIVQLFQQSKPPYIGAIATAVATVLLVVAAVFALVATLHEPEFTHSANVPG